MMSLNLLKDKPVKVYKKMIPFICDVTGRDPTWVNEKSSFNVNDRLPKENWLATHELKEFWTSSARDSNAEKTIYADDRYIMESLISYLFWSREYIKRFKRVIGRLNDRVSVGSCEGGLFNRLTRFVDFGGGIGLSSLHLQQLFDSLGFNIQVVYHNIPTATKQNELATKILNGSRVEMCIQNDLPDGDAFFMSEVLEHLKAPVKFFAVDLLPKRPKMIMHASSFTLPEQPGHFEVYDKSRDGSGDYVTGRQITKHVNDLIKENGFVKTKHVYLWNEKPTVFVQCEALMDHDTYDPDTRMVYL